MWPETIKKNLTILQFNKHIIQLDTGINLPIEHLKDNTSEPQPIFKLHIFNF